MKKRVSFVIPSYQQGEFLGKCLDSIMEQGLDRSEYEVLVHDGGSTDKTIDILRTHASKPVWISGQDGGQANAVNLGMRKASGEIIAWINSDDFYLPDALNYVIDYFEKDSSIRILYGNAIRVDKDGATLMSYPVEDWDYNRLLEKCYLCQPATFFRRDILLDHGFLNENYHLALDLEFWLRIGKYEDFLRVPEQLAAAREYTSNKSNSFPLQMQIEALRAGYVHTGYLSKRRLWSVAENFVFFRNQNLKKSIQSNSENPLCTAYFWALKIFKYLLIKFGAANGVFPWHNMEYQYPSR